MSWPTRTSIIWSNICCWFDMQWLYITYWKPWNCQCAPLLVLLPSNRLDANVLGIHLSRLSRSILQQHMLWCHRHQSICCCIIDFWPNWNCSLTQILLVKNERKLSKYAVHIVVSDKQLIFALSQCDIFVIHDLLWFDLQGNNGDLFKLCSSWLVQLKCILSGSVW